MVWGRCLCASIFIVSKGFSAECCGSGGSFGMGGGGRFSVAFGVVVVAALFGFRFFYSVA